MTAFTWTDNGGDNDWFNPANWSPPGGPPGAADTATISLAATTVNIASAASVGALTLDASGATLTLTSTLTVGTTLTLTAGSFDLNSGGVIAGGTIAGAGVGGLVCNGGTLSGVTFDGTLDLSATSSSLHVVNGITLHGSDGTGSGTVLLTGVGSDLFFSGTETFDNAAVSIGNNFNFSFLREASGTLTLGAGLSLSDTGRYSELYAGSGAVIVNSGTIDAGVASGFFKIAGPGSFVDDGLVSVSNGDGLRAEYVDFTIGAGGSLAVGAGGTAFLGGSGIAFANQGSISLGSGAALHLGGSFSQGSIGSLTNSGGTVFLDGTLDNTGSTLATGSAGNLGSVAIDSGGEILGGTITGEAVGFKGGTLSGVTFDGTLDLSASSASLHVVNGITPHGSDGTGVGTVLLTGVNSSLYFSGTETFDNAAVSIGNNLNYAFLREASGTLTLGAGLTLGDTARYSELYIGSGAVIVNSGTIDAGLTSGLFRLAGPGSFVDDGLVSVSNGDRLHAESVDFTIGAGGSLAVGAGATASLGGSGIAFANQGSISLGSGAALHLGGSFSQGSIGSLTNSGGTVFLDGTLDNSGSTLATGSAANLGSVALDGGGEILGGAITGEAVGFKGGTLSGVTFDGTLDLSASSASLHVVNGITLHGSDGTGSGTVLLTGVGSDLFFSGTETFDNAAVSIGNDGNYALLTEAPGTLTLGAGLTLGDTGRFSELYIDSGGVILNSGTIEAGLTGGLVKLTGPGSFVDDGFVSVSNGDRLRAEYVDFTIGAGGSLAVGAGGTAFLGGSGIAFANQGSISLGSGAALHLGGSFSQGSIGSLTNSGGTVFLDGTLDNTGSTLATGSAANLGSVALDGGGEILGGTITGEAVGFKGGTLSGVTFDGTLDLSATAANLHVVNGITLHGSDGTGAGTVLLTGAASTLYFSGTENFDNAAVSIGNDGNYAFLKEASGTLTLGAGLTLGDTGGLSEIYVGSGAAIINSGTIDAGVSSGLFRLTGLGSFVDDGLVSVSNGDRLHAESVDFTIGAGGSLAVGAGATASLGGSGIAFANQGSISLGSGAALHLGGSFSQGSIGSLTNSGGTVFLDGTLDNTGSTLATGSAANLGSVALDGGGEILGGAITGEAVGFKGGTLSGVTFDGTLDLSASSASLHVVNGITLHGSDGTGSGTVLLTGVGSDLFFSGTETFDNAAVSIGNDGNYALLTEAPGTLTLGAGLTLGDTGRFSELYIDSGGVILNSGTIDAGVSSGVFIIVGPGSFINEGTVAVSNHDFFKFFTPVLDGGGSGSVSLASAAAVEFAGTVGGGEAVTFTDNTGIVRLDENQFAGTIDGFRQFGEVVDLRFLSGGTIQQFNTVTDQLTVVGSNGTVTLQLNPSGDYSGIAWNTHSDGSGGTDVEPACFCRGTMILTEAAEVAVENLAIGDRVVTRSGAARPIKWIGRRSYDGRFIRNNPAVLPILVKEGAIAAGVPRRDLYLSPHHALEIDGVLVPSERLLNGVSVVQCEDVEQVEYFHIELDTHDVVFADGAAAETFVDCDSRGMFHNAHEFALLYPDAEPPRWEFCLPRIEDGEQLERVRRLLAARFGAETPAARAEAAPGPLRGHIDEVDLGRVHGWAFDEAHPQASIALDILDHDRRLGRVYADRYRADLADAGWGDGRHAFEFRFDPPLAPGTGHLIYLRRAADGAALPISPVELPAIASRRSSSAGRHDGRPFALFIDDHEPRPERDAGSNAILGHMRALQRLGWRVAFAAQDVQPAGPALEAAGIECYSLPEHASAAAVLERHGREFDLVYLHRVSNATLYGGLARRHCPRARIVYSVADLHWLRLARQARIEGRIELMAESRRLRLAELSAASSADAVITHSTYEAAALRRLVGADKVHTVPWPLSPRPRRTAWHERFGVAFIGGYKHQPNIDAARWLMHEIMPLVWQRDPGITCLLIGPDMPEELKRSAPPGVWAHGPMPDLSALFDFVRLTVAPLRYGAGLKGKVLDSLAAGVPCAMTGIAAEGLGLPPALAATVADAPAALARLICRLHGEEALNRDCSEAGLAFVAEEFAPARIDGLLARAAGAAPRRQSDAGPRWPASAAGAG